MTKVAILWHMHQPFYEDLVTHEHILPWVRLHALKDYYGMVAMLQDFPEIRVTFNLVPSLLVQLEAFAEDRARDRFLELSLKPAADLNESEIAFVLEHFFHAQRQRMIEAHPRYQELLERRGAQGTPATRDAARRFTHDDLRDLQVWHKLAWVDPLFLDGDDRVRTLVEKGRGFSEDDKHLLRQVEMELLNRVIPEYREAAARGQLELSTSPFYHPILPLLCDTDVYLRTHPESQMPRRPFRHPEDAAEQLDRAVALHERLFGQRPVGLWPSEGSVSDAMTPLAAAAGFTWMATDELILARSLGLTFGRDGYGHLERPEHLYAPYVLTSGDARMTCAFRDHVLSDLIGFTYAGWEAEAAAADFVGRLMEAGRRYESRTAGQSAVISVILDGENAWEHFEGGGRPFLRALYGRLSRTRELQTVTMAEACAEPRNYLTGIFPGSWIDANFFIWMGHPDDQRAWSQLADARSALDEAPHVDPVRLQQAREELLIAEGSDWCWWYGEDHSSEHDLAFDDLFRRHLRNVYTLLERAVPDELFVSNISAGAPAVETVPSAFISPTLDGEETSYFEWLGAGALEISETVGAMHQTDHRSGILTGVQYGFDPSHFYCRLDAGRRLADLLADGHRCSVTFLRPRVLRFTVWKRDGGVGVTLSERAIDTPDWVDRGSARLRVAAATVIEAALPLQDLGVSAGSALAFFVSVTDADGREIERHPRERLVELTVPDEWFAARNWSA